MLRRDRKLPPRASDEGFEAWRHAMKHAAWVLRWRLVDRTRLAQLRMASERFDMLVRDDIVKLRYPGGLQRVQP